MSDDRSNDLMEDLWKRYFGTQTVAQVTAKTIIPTVTQEERIAMLEKKIEFLFSILPIYSTEDKNETPR